MNSASLRRPIYFSGKVKHPNPKSLEEMADTFESFCHWVMTVRVDQPDVPTEPAALAKFDIDSLIPEYHAFIKGGGKSPEHGASLQEFCLATQLHLRRLITCWVNVDQREQEVTRIKQLRRLCAAEIWTELEKAYAEHRTNYKLPVDTPGFFPATTAVYDGDDIAHFINAWTIRDEELHFGDPWPGRSLLCAENNSAGVAARESNLIRGVDPKSQENRASWRITRAEFERVVYAVFLYPQLPPSLVDLTQTEQEAANQQRQLLRVLRRFNPPDARPFEGARKISRLQAAALLNRVWEVKVAINERDDINECGVHGNTALHFAAEMGHLEIAQLLTQFGADCRARNAAGKTPVDLAIAKKNVLVVEYLKSQV
jgi:hypothetical protein